MNYAVEYTAIDDKEMYFGERSIVDNLMQAKRFETAAAAKKYEVQFLTKNRHKNILESKCRVVNVSNSGEKASYWASQARF